MSNTAVIYIGICCVCMVSIPSFGSSRPHREASIDLAGCAPKEAIVVFEYRGYDIGSTGFAQSRLKKILDDDQARAQFEQLTDEVLLCSLEVRLGFKMSRSHELANEIRSMLLSSHGLLFATESRDAARLDIGMVLRNVQQSQALKIMGKIEAAITASAPKTMEAIVFKWSTGNTRWNGIAVIDRESARGVHAPESANDSVVTALRGKEQVLYATGGSAVLLATSFEAAEAVSRTFVLDSEPVDQTVAMKDVWGQCGSGNWTVRWFVNVDRLCRHLSSKAKAEASAWPLWCVRTCLHLGLDRGAVGGVVEFAEGETISNTFIKLNADGAGLLFSVPKNEAYIDSVDWVSSTAVMLRGKLDIGRLAAAVVAYDGARHEDDRAFDKEGQNAVGLLFANVGSGCSLRMMCSAYSELWDVPVTCVELTVKDRKEVEAAVAVLHRRAKLLPGKSSQSFTGLEFVRISQCWYIAVTDKNVVLLSLGRRVDEEDVSGILQAAGRESAVVLALYRRLSALEKCALFISIDGCRALADGVELIQEAYHPDIGVLPDFRKWQWTSAIGPHCLGIARRQNGLMVREVGSIPYVGQIYLLLFGPRMLPYRLN